MLWALLPGRIPVWQPGGHWGVCPRGDTEPRAEAAIAHAEIYWFCFLLVLILQHWDVFKQVTEVFILVPALLGLKGNLEMTLASRLSTAVSAGEGQGDLPGEGWWLGRSNSQILGREGTAELHRAISASLAGQVLSSSPSVLFLSSPSPPLQGQRLSFVCPFSLGKKQTNKSICLTPSPLLGICCPAHRDLVPPGPGHLLGCSGGVPVTRALLALVCPPLGLAGAALAEEPSQECRTLPHLPWWLQGGHGDTSTAPVLLHPPVPKLTPRAFGLCLPSCAFLKSWNHEMGSWRLQSTSRIIQVPVLVAQEGLCSQGCAGSSSLPRAPPALSTAWSGFSGFGFLISAALKHLRNSFHN